MASYNSLPVFKTVYDLLLRIHTMGRHMQRDIRFTLGESLKKEIMNLLVLIYKANKTTQKVEPLELSIETLVTIKLNIRILFDLKQITVKQYASLVEVTESASKQLTAWKKNSLEKNEIN